MRLILCDGHRLLLEALGSALRRSGHDVLDVLYDPAVLAGRVAVHQPDACVLEATYAGTIRWDVLVAVRESCPDAAVVVLTSQAPALVWRAFDNGLVDAVVSKASSFASVEQAICEAAGGRRLVAGFGRPHAPARRSHQELDALTPREREVLRMLVEGLSTVSIAGALDVSRNTVRSHVASVLRKLSVHDRAKAVSNAVDQGILADPVR
ncbi:MAG: response regulator transcription factor [Nocardioidaceae bacterium]